MTMKRIGILINSLSKGGAEKVAITLYEQLIIKGYNVFLIVMEKEQNSYNVEFFRNIIYVREKKINSSFVNLLLTPYLAIKLKNIIQENKLTLIQSHLFRASYVNILSKVLFKSNHTCQVVNHTIITSFYKKDLVSKVNKYLIKLLFPKSDTLISVSDIVSEDMQKFLGMENNKKFIRIYNPFDIKNIKKRSMEPINKFIFDENKKYLISVGRLVRVKRNEDIINLLQFLPEDIELIILGEGEWLDSLKKFANSLNLDKRVHFLGNLENPYKFIKKSNILITASESESFGNVVIESLICNTVVLATKCGGPEEILKGLGYLVNIGDIKEMKKIVNMILENEILEKEYLKNSKMLINKFDINCIVEEYEKIICVE